jgi:hypothetical protein
VWPAFTDFSAEIVKSLGKIITATAQAALDVGTGIATGIVDGMTQGLKDAWGGVQNTWSNLVGTITGSGSTAAADRAAEVKKYWPSGVMGDSDKNGVRSRTEWLRLNSWVGFPGGPKDNTEYQALKNDSYKAYASGGRNITGGLSLVGERGPEFVNLPGGADVFNNAESMRMVADGIRQNISQMSMLFAQGVAESMRAGMSALTAPALAPSAVAPQPAYGQQATNNTSYSTVNNFNQTVHSSAPGDQTISNFGLLAAMAGGSVRGI